MSALDDVRDEAILGSFCPKMCNFACPVATATGRETDTPWGLHVTVSSLARGQTQPDDASYGALTGCTGCHACRDACLYELDVPAQVRAARASHGPADHPAVARVVAAVDDGRTPYGGRPVQVDPGPDDPEVQVVLGCRDDADVVAAMRVLLERAGVAAKLVSPPGCCGAVLTDVGLPDRGRELAGRLGERLDPQVPTVALDPHCLPMLRTVVDADVEDSLTLLCRLIDDGRLPLGATDTTGSVTFHDPCVLVRDEGTIDAPRRLLSAAGYEVDEPLAAGRRTACSGAGMGMDLLDPTATAAVADRRSEQLGATGSPVATACGRARRVLQAAGTTTDDIHVLLAGRVGGTSP
ncbi:MAG: (Fe-S)-binding protein [Actinobacteria bacterium]|nr:(Fe-S)-binding protein [Actinomycetota bacterium]